jgi:hypothetical protein
MPRLETPWINNFLGGEISPLAYGRGDLQKYGSSLAEMTNFIPKLQGPAMRRSGFRYVATGKTADSKIRLIPFRFSDTDAMIIELGDDYARFYKNEDVVGGPYELTSTGLAEDDLADLSYVQSGDVIFFAHENYAPFKLSRLADDSWTKEDIEFFDGPFNIENDDPTLTLDPSSTGRGAPGTLTASSAYFTVNDEGRLFRLQDDNVAAREWGTVKVNAGGFVSPTLVNMTVQREMETTTATTASWRAGAFYTGNYPRTVTLHNSRLIYGGDPEHPQTYYASVIDDFTNFCPSGIVSRLERAWDDITGRIISSNDITDENGFYRTTSGPQQDPINWIAPARGIVVGSGAGTWNVQPSSEFELLGPLNVGSVQSSDKGSNRLKPERVGESLFYISDSDREALLLTNSPQTGDLAPERISILAEHLLQEGDGIVDMAYTSEPDSIVWMARSDGALIGCSIDTRQQVLGFHQHNVGTGLVTSLAAIPTKSGSITADAHDNIAHDQLWAVVKYGTAYLIGFMEDDWRSDVAAEDYFGVDMGITYDGVSTTSISGLTHLNGKDVWALADGEAQGPFTVSAGSITLTTAAEKAQVGELFTSTLTLLTRDTQDPLGSARGKLRRVVGAAWDCWRSRGGSVVSGAQNDPLDIGDGAVGTEIKIETIDFASDYEAQLSTLQDKPYPFVIRGIRPIYEQAGGGAME